MKIQQLSVFLENKPGHLRHPVRALSDAGINIVTLCLADTQKFGILRLLVRDWQRAKQVLEDSGCVVDVTDVLAIEVPDHPGGLDRVLAALEPAEVNIDYMYAFTLKRAANAVIIMRFADPDRAAAALQKSGINVLERVAFYAAAQGDAANP